MADENVPLLPLPVPEHAEVAELVIGVNRVLKALELRENALLESEVFRRAIIDSVAYEIRQIIDLGPQGDGLRNLAP